VTTIGAAEVCAALREAGIHVTPDQIKCEAREQRTLVILPKQRVAWFPDSDEGRKRLKVERHALRLIADRCSFCRAAYPI